MRDRQKCIGFSRTRSWSLALLTHLVGHEVPFSCHAHSKALHLSILLILSTFWSLSRSLCVLAVVVVKLELRNLWDLGDGVQVVHQGGGIGFQGKIFRICRRPAAALCRRRCFRLRRLTRIVSLFTACRRRRLDLDGFFLFDATFCITAAANVVVLITVIVIVAAFTITRLVCESRSRNCLRRLFLLELVPFMLQTAAVESLFHGESRLLLMVMML